MDTVRIGAVDYRIEAVKKLKREGCRLWGDIKYNCSRIRIVDKLGPQARRITLWHEIIHGILTQGGESKQDERQIDILAHGIVEVLRDNEWLREGTC